MSCEILLEAVGEETVGQPRSEGSAALQPSEEPRLTLRFSISAAAPAGLDALRHARRSMLREEWTLGRNPEEPSLEAAVFSSTEILWTVPRSRREWCLQRLAELTARANRVLAEHRSS